jgi:hypothetical protein
MVTPWRMKNGRKMLTWKTGQRPEIRTYGEDKEIVAEGEHSSHFCVVLSGNVKVTRHGRRLAILEERKISTFSSTETTRSLSKRGPVKLTSSD